MTIEKRRACVTSVFVLFVEAHALAQQTGDSVFGDVEREVFVDFALDSSEFSCRGESK